MLNLDKLLKHTGVGKSFAPKVSLSPGGLISVNEAATKKYGVDTYIYAVLYYDPENELVAIRLTNDKDTGTIRLRHRPAGTYIAAASFKGNFEITVTGTTLYDLQLDKESGYLFFDLKSGTTRKPPRAAAATKNDDEQKR